MSLTIPLSGDERGDERGPGTSRDMDRCLDKFTGRPPTPGRLGLSGCCGGEEPCLVVGRTDDVVDDLGRGGFVGVVKLGGSSDVIGAFREDNVVPASDVFEDLAYEPSTAPYRLDLRDAMLCGVGRRS